MKRLLWLLPFFAFFAHVAQAQTPSLVYCIQATATPCNSLASVNPYTGSEGDQAYQFNTKENTNWLFVQALFSLPNGSLVGNTSGSANALNAISLGTGLSFAGNVLNSSGGGVCSGTCVTSVNVSLNTCTSSGPVTTSGTITLTGCLFPLAMGGLGASSFQAAGLVQFTAANPVSGHCPQWSGTTGLQVDSGAPCAGTSSGSRTQWVSETSNTTLSVSNTSVLGDATSGAVTMTLPAGASDTHTYCVTKKDSTANTVSVTTTGGATIQFVAPPAILSFQGSGICVNSDSSGNWVF